MSKTVLISLAAVVALIVIVVLLGMRYLRADDEEEFGDEMAAEHDRSGGRGGHLGRDHHTRLRSHHEDLEDPRRARGSTRNGSGGRERGPDLRGAARAERDRRRGEDSGEMSRSGRSPQRNQHLVKLGGSGRRDYPDMSEPVAVPARPARSQPGRAGRGGPDRFESQPRRAVSARDYEHDTMERRGRRETGDRFSRREDPGFPDTERQRDRDRLGDRDGREDGDGRGGRESRSGRDIRDVRDGRQARDGRDVSERRESRPAASLREDAEREERGRRGATRPNSRPDARRNGAKPDREALPAVKPRQGRNKRDGEGDWPTTEWDELSDVDYWAELASDKPLTAATPTADTSRLQRREARQEARSGQDARARQDVRAGARQPATSGVESTFKQSSPQERQPERALVSAETRTPPSRTAAPRTTPPRTSSSRPIPDDDPLTSPTFPRITSEDSRSYRRTRVAAGDSRQSASHSGPMPAIGNDYAAPSGYPAPAIDQAAAGYANSVPAGYHTPAAENAGFQRGIAGFSDMPGATAGYSPPASTAGGYRTAADPLANAGYSTPGAEAGAYSLPGGMSAGSYLPSGPPTADRFGGVDVRGGYPGPEPGGFRPEEGQIAQASYQNPLPSASGYQAAGNYSIPGDPAGYLGQQAGLPGGYHGSGSPPGSYQRPEAGYHAERYAGGSGSAAHGSLPGGPGDPADPGYLPGYREPVPGSHTAQYQSPATQLPGYPEYGHGSYNPASVTAQTPEGPGYAGGDPYAADPYGLPGYGSTGY